jgi:hypothetical protein
LIGHIKLGAGMKQIVQTGKDDIEKLNGDDDVVVAPMILVNRTLRKC